MLDALGIAFLVYSLCSTHCWNGFVRLIIFDKHKQGEFYFLVQLLQKPDADNKGSFASLAAQNNSPSGSGGRGRLLDRFVLNKRPVERSDTLEAPVSSYR